MTQTKLQNVTLRAKQFSTGSIGFYAFGKVVVNGQICQAGLNVVEVGSKGKKFEPSADRIETLNVGVKEREFKTGSKGYMALGKVALNGKIYQVGGNLTIVGSKNR